MLRIQKSSREIRIKGDPGFYALSGLVILMMIAGVLLFVFFIPYARQHPPLDVIVFCFLSVWILVLVTGVLLMIRITSIDTKGITYPSNKFDCICIEDLRPSVMLKDKRLSKAVSDANFGEI